MVVGVIGKYRKTLRTCLLAGMGSLSLFSSQSATAREDDLLCGDFGCFALETLLHKYDFDGDGRISRSEWEVGLFSRAFLYSITLQEDDSVEDAVSRTFTILRSSFALLDRSGNGFIDSGDVTLPVQNYSEGDSEALCDPQPGNYCA